MVDSPSTGCRSRCCKWVIKGSGVTAVAAVDIIGWTSLVSAYFNISNVSLWTQSLSEQGESQATSGYSTSSLFLSQDVSPPRCPLSGPQLDGPLAGPVSGRCRTGSCGCIFDGEAVGATRLVHIQVVLL